MQAYFNAYEEIQLYFNSDNPSTYFNTRNQLIGNKFSTRLSCYLSLGVITVNEIYNFVKAYESYYQKNKSTYWIVFELIWRDFFYWHYQSNKNSYFSKNGLGPSSLKIDKLKESDTLEFKLQNHYFTRAALKELKNTGFFSTLVPYLCFLA